jgi:hypothetical protein
MYQRIQEKLADIIKNHTVPSLPDKILAELQRIKRQGEKELSGQQT